MQTNPKVTNIAVPAAGQPPVLIVGTMQASRVEVMEDPSLNAGVAQGLTGYYMDNAAARGSTPAKSNPTQQVWLPNTAGQQGQAYQPIRFGGDGGRVHGAVGEYTSSDSTPLLLLNSATGTATGVLLVEWA